MRLSEIEVRTRALFQISHNVVWDTCLAAHYPMFTIRCTRIVRSWHNLAKSLFPLKPDILSRILRHESLPVMGY